ncbi:MAG: alpha/beta fold hydrolase [Promethearchaeota archaeon]
MEWKSSFIIGSDKKIHYYYSENNKPPLLLLHGAMDNGMCWIPTANKLAEKYWVIMPDARGHGLTEIPKKIPFSFDLMVNDVAFLVKELKLNKFQIIGHSMGANVAALFTSKYPDLVQKVVLEDPAFIAEKFPGYSKPFLFLILGILGNMLIRGSYAKIYKRVKKQNPTWPEEVFKPWTESKLQYKKKDKYYLFGLIHMQYYWRTIMQDIKCPVLLISSSNGILSDKKVKEAMQLAKYLEWIKIDKAGHNIRREQPEKYMQALDKFLD